MANDLVKQVAKAMAECNHGVGVSPVAYNLVAAEAAIAVVMAASDDVKIAYLRMELEHQRKCAQEWFDKAYTLGWGMDK